MRNKTYTFRATAREAEIIELYCKKEKVSTSDAIRSLMGEKLFYYGSNHDEALPEADFSNNQTFRVGQRVEFYCKPESGDKFAGIHVVKKVRYDKVNKVWGIQTDVSQRVASPKDLFIAVHWFRPAKGKK